MAFALKGAAAAGVLPCKWGGVFGQEFTGRLTPGVSDPIAPGVSEPLSGDDDDDDDKDDKLFIYINP